MELKSKETLCTLLFLRPKPNQDVPSCSLIHNTSVDDLVKTSYTQESGIHCEYKGFPRHADATSGLHPVTTSEASPPSTHALHI
ncbi:hypothetical protein AAG906_040980 [Vitis piasezkii]